MSDQADADRDLVEGQYADDGRTVTWTRAGVSVTVRVFRGRVPVIVRERGGVGFVGRNRDYILPYIADLDFGAGAVVPQERDRVTDSDGVYDLMPLEGEPCWRWTNEHKHAYRVHAIEV